MKGHFFLRRDKKPVWRAPAEYYEKFSQTGAEPGAVGVEHPNAVGVEHPKLQIHTLKQLRDEGVLPRHIVVANFPEVAWYEAPIGDTSQWTAAYRLVPQRGRVIIAEIRLFPRERRHMIEPGEWSAEYLGPGAHVPRGGITARLVRKVRLGLMAKPGTSDSEITRLVTWWREQLNEEVRDVGAEGILPHQTVNLPPPPGTPRRRGRPAWPDRRYAQVAKAYAEELVKAQNEKRPPHPAQAIMKRLKLESPAKARDAIKRARERGFLTAAPGYGRVGGFLTPRAKALLRSNASKKTRPNAKATRRRPAQHS